MVIGSDLVAIDFGVRDRRGIHRAQTRRVKKIG